MTMTHTHKALLWVLALAGEAALFGSLLFLRFDDFPRFERIMMTAAPAVFLGVLLIFLLASLLLRSDILAIYSRLKPLALSYALLFVLGYSCIFLLTRNHYHLIWYDEDIYEAQACSTASSLQSRICGYGIREGARLLCLDGPYNKEPVGYPTLLSLFYTFSGCTEKYNALYQAMIYALLISALSGIGLLLFDDKWTAFCGTAITTLTYPLLLWWRSMAIEPTAMTVSAVAVLAMLLSFRLAGSRKALLLAFSSLTLASMLRPEGSSIWLLFALGVILFAPCRRAYTRQLAIHTPLIVLLMMTQVLHFIMFYDFTWGNDEAGGKFFWHIVPENLKTNLAYFFDSKDLFIGVTLLALSAVLPCLAPNHSRAKLFLACWFLLFFSVFIPFYAGSYDYGMDSRFVLLCLAPLGMLAALPLCRIPPWAAIIVIVSMTAPYFAKLARPIEQVRDTYADHQYGEILLSSVEPDALVITPNPQMTMMIGVNTLYDGQLEQYLKTREAELRRFSKYYFYFSFWCNAAPRKDPGRSYCMDAIEKYNGRLIGSFKEQAFTYSLYQLTIPGFGDKAPAR